MSKQLDISVSGSDAKIDELVAWLRGTIDESGAITIQADADNMTKDFTVFVDAIQE